MRTQRPLPGPLIQAEAFILPTCREEKARLHAARQILALPKSVFLFSDFREKLHFSLGKGKQVEKRRPLRFAKVLSWLLGGADRPLSLIQPVGAARTFLCCLI